ncbi:hypothetical protein C922_02318 [Plasmodium inui San Antonio 1]|uniref:RRM domain-containing protein n=1 Tax=Plasmodium inui San Antonio 1 TaxID=1237626 RepID=W7A7C8_9APIC|nr:hypothetical protein C922_02318 [Plasmodium inui San Antonio 1]EUD67168.1 hypothetical protein C922_02318 [Plasmodium inui San Antonio 1]
MKGDTGVDNTPMRDDAEETQSQVNDTLPFGKHIEHTKHMKHMNHIEKLKINSVSTGVDSHRSSAKSSSNQITFEEATQYALSRLSKRYNQRDDVVETLTITEGGKQEHHSTERKEKVNYKLDIPNLGEYHLGGDNLEGQPTSGRHPNGDTQILGKSLTNDFLHISGASYKSKKEGVFFNNLQKVATSHMEEDYVHIWGDDSLLPCEYNLEQFGLDIYGAMEEEHKQEEQRKQEEESIRGEDRGNNLLELTKQHSLTENRGDNWHQDKLTKRGDKMAVEDNKRGIGTRRTNRVGISGGVNPDWGITYAQNGLAEMTLPPRSTASDLLTSFFPPPGRSHLLGGELATSAVSSARTADLTAALTHVSKFEAFLRDEILQQTLNQNYYYDLRTDQVWVPGEDAGGDVLGRSDGEGSPPREEATHRTTIHGETTPVAASIGTINNHGLLPPFGLFPNESQVANGSHGEGRIPKSGDPNFKMMEDPFLKIAQDALFTKRTEEFPLLDDRALFPFYDHHGNPSVQEKEQPQIGTFTDEKETYMQYMLGENFILDKLGTHHKEEEMETGRIDKGGNQSASPNCVPLGRHFRETHKEDYTALQRGDNWGNVQMGNNTNLTRLTQMEETLLSQRNRFALSLCETEGMDFTNSCNVGGENRWGEKRQDGEVTPSYHFAYEMPGPYDDHQPDLGAEHDWNVANQPNSYNSCCGNFFLNYAMEEEKKRKNKNKTQHDDGFRTSSDSVLPQDCDIQRSSMVKHTEEGNQKDNHNGENVTLGKRLSKSLAKYTLIVNVPSNTTRKDLLSVFSKFGNVDLTMVVCDKKSRHPNKEWTATSGYAFVRFSTNMEARRTLNAACAGGIRIRGSRVRATWAKKDSYSKREKEITFKIPSSILLINIDEFICSICKINLSYEPILFPCCYSSCCSDCLRGYLVLHAVRPNIQCPSCSVHLSDGLIKIDEHSSGVMALLYKIHSNVKIKCQNDNCKWVGSQNQYVNHFFSCKFGLA